LSVDSYGLCSNCRPAVVLEVQSRTRIINDCIKLVENSANVDIQYSRAKLLIEQARELEKYEKLGIMIMEPTPSQFVQKYSNVIKKKVIEGLKAEYANVLSKAEVMPTVKARINVLSKMLLRIREYKGKIDSSTMLDSLEQQIATEISKTQLNGYLEEAKKNEFKGQKKKALDKYYEALYLLKHDDVDDSLQQDNIQFLESKIKELGGLIQ
jgi:hypothetical protein